MISLAIIAKWFFIGAECSTVFYGDPPQQGSAHTTFNSSIQGFSGKQALNMQYFQDFLV